MSLLLYMSIDQNLVQIKSAQVWTWSQASAGPMTSLLPGPSPWLVLRSWWALISLFGRTVGWLGLYSSLKWTAGILAFYTHILYTNASYLWLSAWELTAYLVYNKRCKYGGQKQDQGSWGRSKYLKWGAFMYTWGLYNTRTIWRLYRKIFSRYNRI